MKNLMLLILIAAISVFIFKTYQNQNNDVHDQVMTTNPTAVTRDTITDNEQIWPPTPAEIRHPIPALSNENNLVNPPVETQAPSTGHKTNDLITSNQHVVEQLNLSDDSLLLLLHTVFGEGLINQLLRKTDIVRNTVVFIDNLTREKAPQKHSPFLPTAGRFIIHESGNENFIANENADHYTSYIKFISLISDESINKLYIQNYPLFQEAYEELGYPDGYFNDRVIAVIDHLLSTPEITQPVKLNRPKVLYTYADLETEALSAGQKQILRSNPDQQRKIKNKLLEIRNALATID